MKRKLLLLFLLFFICGCVTFDELYLTAEEQYVIGWVLHNISSSTPTALEYTLANLSVFNYSFNYPANEAQTYANVLFLCTPVHVGGGAIEVGQWAYLGLPLNRTYFVMGVNPVPEYYRTNWSFANFMQINYLVSDDPEEQWNYEDVHQEHYNSTDPFHAITPRPGQTFNVYFGTAPFRPTHPKVDSNLILIDHLLKGYLGNSYLLRETWALENLGLVPTYEIYWNDVLNVSGNLTDWNYTLLNHDVSTPGTYLLNLTIPSSYPVWNFTLIQAKFEVPSTDSQPPFLKWLRAAPYFEEGRDYEVELKVEDNASIYTTRVSYRFDEDAWTNLTTLTNTTPIAETATYEGYFTVPAGVQKIDLKIHINDSLGNELNYTILPVALPAQSLSIKISCPHHRAVYVPEGDILDYELESPHPYPPRYNYTWRINQTGFTQIAVHFAKIGVWEGYDWIIVKDGLNRTVARYTGSFEDLWTPSVGGDTLYVTLVSKFSDYGFYIDAVLNGSVSEICEVLRGSEFYIEGLVRDEAGEGIGQLRLEHFLNQSYEGRAITHDGLFEDSSDIPCDLLAPVNFTINFTGTGVYLPAEGKIEVRPTPLDFTINQTLPIHTWVELNASAPGALLTINRSDISWVWSHLMEKEEIEFELHNYGNYTLKLNTTCGEEALKSVFVNITTTPFIYRTSFHPAYPMSYESIGIEAEVHDEAWHNVSLNVSNETFWQVYDFTWLQAWPGSVDWFTGEPYNHTLTLWSVELLNLEADVYDVLIEVRDVAGFVVSEYQTLYVFPPIDVAFNLTDWEKNPVERTIHIAFDHFEEVRNRTYDVVGEATVTLPNVTHFAPEKNVSTHLWMVNHLLEENSTQTVIFTDTSLRSLMEVISEHQKGKAFVEEHIHYLVYAYRPNWDYGSTILMGIFNLENFGLLREQKVSASGEADGHNHLCENITLLAKSDIEVVASFRSINDTNPRIFVASLDCPESEGQRWYTDWGCKYYRCSPGGKYCYMGAGWDGTYSYTFEGVEAGSHRVCVWPSSESGYLWDVDLILTSFHTPAKIYTCAEWDFENKICMSDWGVLSEEEMEILDHSLYIKGTENKTEAFALGEPQYCGDGYCNPGLGEDCSTCPTDCGACPIIIPITVPAALPPPTYVYDFSLSLPSRLEMLPNESKTFSIHVKNTANGTLTSLTIKVESEPDCDCVILIAPELVSSLEADETVGFEVEVPAGIEVGEYLLIFNVSCDQLSKTTSLTLEVKEPPEKAEASRLIAEAERLIKERVEYNVTEAEEYLRRAREAFALANYAQAIELARLAITAAEAAPPLSKPWAFPWWIVAMLIGVSICVLIFLFLRRRKEPTWEELYRKWVREVRA